MQRKGERRHLSRPADSPNIRLDPQQGGAHPLPLGLLVVVQVVVLLLQRLLTGGQTPKKICRIGVTFVSK